MLTQQPDPNSNTWELENTLSIIRQAVRKAPSWQFREEYIDRGILDPYCILMIRETGGEQLDATWDQTLFQGERSEFSFVHRTTQCTKNYWCEVDTRELLYQLDRFKKQYDANQLQPPGSKGDLFAPRERHEIFKDRRYIYEIRSPFKNLTAIGPSKYALGPGAICGTVYNGGGQSTDPVIPKGVDGVTIQLIQEGKTILSRQTKNGGLFWFSKVPAGSYQVRVKERSCTVQLLRRDEFGNIKGWLTDQDGYPVEYADLHFRAPDGEHFSTSTDETGKFRTGPLPAFPLTDSPLSNYPYLMEIPGFLFSLTQTLYVKDAIISGVLRSQGRKILPNHPIRLKQNRAQLAETTTDTHGHFRFFGLTGGTYELEVPEQKIYLSHLPGGRITGIQPNGDPRQTRVELVAEGNTVATERISMDKRFHFNDVPPGKYEVVFRQKGSS